MNEIKIIHESELLERKFKIYGTFEEPLFLAKDVAEWIEHADVSSMLRSVDEDEKVLRLMSGVPGSAGGNPNKWFLTENGLYEVLMLSRKPIAKQFKSQVKVILKSIRRNGGYIAATGTETPEELYARAMTSLKAALDRQKAIAAEQAGQLKLQAPDVEYARTVLASDGLHTVNSIAVHLGISAIRLNKFLIGENWIYRQGATYYPYSGIRDKGYCDFHIVPYLNSQGEKMTREHLKWTETGRRAIIELWNKRHPAK